VVASGAAALRRSQRRYGVERLRPQQHDQQRPARRRHRVARDRLRGADNFAYRAIDVTTQTAKALIDRYYSDQPAFSYFLGCSMGGREAMMVTQKLPTYFDGSVIGDPGFMLVSMSTRSRRSTRARRRTSRF